MNKISPIFCGLYNYTVAVLAIAFLLPVSTTFAQADIAPVVTASGAQQYCPGTALAITTAFNITDANDSGTSAIYIQISSGYVNGQDILTLNFPGAGVTSTWDATTAKLTITSNTAGQDVPYVTLINAVQSVTYNNTSANPTSGTRTFSITVGDANYLPSTQHYYKYVSSLGITWSSAKTAAENSTYYGLQGYLATLLALDEAQLCGKQTTGTGWIGGSDAATEGIWKWVTGPEAGTTFWNGGANGSTPNFAFWNTGEPNNAGDEDYVHITAPGVGTLGSWNDLPNAGSGGDYTPKGYIVEFGGMPGDPALQISASTSIDVDRLTSTTGAARCGDGSVTLQAVTTGATAYWYDAPTGGNLLTTGTTFQTPALTQTTTYYASAYPEGCNATRTAVIATVNTTPTLTVNPADAVCEGSSAQLTASASAGSTIRWYDAQTGGTLLGTGSPFTTQPLMTAITFYAEAVNNGCPATTRQAVTIDVLDLPEASDYNVTFCENDSVILNAGLSGMGYEWSTGETTQTITVDQPGMYTVKITNPAGCSATATIIATTEPAANILRAEVNTDKVVVIMNDPELSSYEFSIDGGPFKASNIFTNVSPGNHTVYARSINGCGSDYKSFAVYMIPKFFTPNGDNTNDVFTLAGMSAYPDATVTIFDRYGQVLAALSNRNRSWDGTFNGSRLPATDYWYIIQLEKDSEEIKGHFSLIR
ncbi:T9SS type B sorting domain-containing protein [Flavobacterium sp. DG1-102-2]|uniref:Ig-like domain-containing protein n=1 Tax=Flavobacterium sp. DG1-102-2 TaxID=3081663 RepID=UPI00294A72E5|nr:T9SS type B sorting domain-containing protein [Flavobacterium sp. DG1-102-2]MDV6169047.1 T9SS type B sorting domain-containing protein [Flavobacterium sp. DG1-102-2]